MPETLIQYCTTPHCDVAIRVPFGQQESVPVCKWCLNNTNYYAVQRAKLARVRTA